MERENHINPELTGQAQNAYSNGRGNNMPEGGEGAPISEGDLGRLQGPDVPVEVRRAAEEVSAEQQGAVSGENIEGAPIQDSTPDVPEAGVPPVTESGGGSDRPPGDRPPTGEGVPPPDPDENREHGNEEDSTHREGDSRRGPDGEEDEAGGSNRRREESRRQRQEMRTRVGIGEIFGDKTFQNTELENIVASLKRTGERIVSDPDKILEFEARAREIARLNPAATSEVNEMLGYLGQVRSGVGEVRDTLTHSARRIHSLTLTEADLDSIIEDPIGWQAEQFEELYAVAKRGQELDSPFVGSLQSRITAASVFLNSIPYGKDNPEIIEQFTSQFQSRLNLLLARSVIQQRNMEGISGISKKIQMHGVMNTLTFEGGLVNKMHNRLNELSNDTRLTLAQQHITPEVHSQLQDRVIEEYYQIIRSDHHLMEELGVTGDMSEAKQEKVARAAILRATRTAYDHFVATQREAVIVARGDALPNSADLQGILADPSGLFMMFNYEQLLVEKFGLLNHEQQEYFSAIKRRYAISVLSNSKDENGNKINIDRWVRERISQNPELAQGVNSDKAKENVLVDYGKELIKDLMFVNDFYSSAWRTDEFLNQIDDNLKYQVARERGVRITELSEQDLQDAKDKASDFALFMRLRAIHASPSTPKPEKSAAKRVVWGKIAEFKPEDIVQIFRENQKTDAGTNNRGSELNSVNEAFHNAGIELTDSESSRGVTYYDKFKETYGGALRFVREMGYSKGLPEQIDFSQINSNANYREYRDVLVKILAKPESNEPEAVSRATREAEAKVDQIAETYRIMKEFAGDANTVNKLMNDTRFSSVYTRTTSVDDALLDRMEFSGDNVTGRITTVSNKLSPEPGGDAYVRTFNDAVSATEAHTGLLNFLMTESLEEKVKIAKGAAAATKRYSSPTAGAKVFRALVGSHLEMGNVAEGGWLSKGTMLEIFDIHKLPFNQPINELQRIFGDSADVYSNDDLNRFLKEHKMDFLGGEHDKKDAEALWQEMRRLTKTRARDKTRMMQARLMIFAMLYILLEGTLTVKEGLKTDELK